jgi:hypothetical protein
MFSLPKEKMIDYNEVMGRLYEFFQAPDQALSLMKEL